jgi:hypothetical protein
VEVREISEHLGRSTTDGSPLVGSDVFLDFSRTDAPIEPADMTPGELYKIGLGDPYLSGDQLLSAVLATIDDLRTRKKFIRRVLAGDLQSLRSFWNAEGIRHALGVLMAILRRVGIPAILFETAVPRAMTTEHGIETGYEVFPVQQPRIVDFADVVIEIQSTSRGRQNVMFAFCARSGLKEKLQV